MKKILGLALLGAAALAAPAEAHTFGAAGAGLAEGAAHPISGLDHLMAMVAVGLWGAQTGGRARWAMPLAFVAAMVLGGALGMTGFVLPGVETGIAGSVLILGALIALAARMPLAAGLGLIALMGVFHGHAHGAEMPETASPLLYALGFVAVTAALHAAGVIAGTAALKAVWMSRALRLAGAAVAVSGLIMVSGF